MLICWELSDAHAGEADTSPGVPRPVEEVLVASPVTLLVLMPAVDPTASPPAATAAEFNCRSKPARRGWSRLSVRLETSMPVPTPRQPRLGRRPSE